MSKEYISTISLSERILKRICELWNIHKSELLPEVTFSDYQFLCLENLGLASDLDLNDYDIDKYALLKFKKFETNQEIIKLQNEIVDLRKKLRFYSNSFEDFKFLTISPECPRCYYRFQIGKKGDIQ